jgi:hypothetical protein
MTFKAVFPRFWVRDRSGQERPEAFEPVSGRNILILPLDASDLRLDSVGRQNVKFAGTTD